MEDPYLPASTEFRTIIDQFGLVQNVTEPTHKAGGWLDVVLTRDDCNPSMSIHRLSPIMVSLLPSFRFSVAHHLTSSGRFATGVASTGRHFPQRYSRYRPLLIHPSSTIFQLQVFLQPTKRRWRKSSKDSYQPVRRESVVVVSGHGSTQNVGSCAARPVVWRDCTGATGHLQIALRG